MPPAGTSSPARRNKGRAARMNGGAAMPDLSGFADFSGFAPGVLTSVTSEQFKQPVGKAASGEQRQFRADLVAALRSSAHALWACRKEQRATRAVQERILEKLDATQQENSMDQGAKEASMASIAESLAMTAKLLKAEVPAADDK